MLKEYVQSRIREHDRIKNRTWLHGSPSAFVMILAPIHELRFLLIGTNRGTGAVLAEHKLLVRHCL